MITKNLYQSFEIEFVETTECPVSAHKHTFFEMVYIMEGSGTQSINNHNLPYSADKMFLLFPQDCHSFNVHTPTKFFFIRFNNDYLKSQGKEWIQKLEYIFHNHNHMPVCILRNISDKPLMRALAEALLREQVNKHYNHQELTRQIVNTMITIAARNMSALHHIPLKVDPPQTTTAIINYIHQNIYNPESLKAERIAEAFHRSPTYINEYFKKQTGETLQQYILKYKLKLIETRLTYSDMRVSEIAYEFGFTDDSHLSKMFKKLKGLNPTEFRRQRA
ncbi:MAG TPA: AraC family transcriptional regulator [Cytophagales bacterium]|nr:AraC family transcriptional regulator [Cytophagales bacterium]